MRPALSRLQLIEQQLLNSPAALPADEWHLHQLLDGELAADAAAQQQLYDGLRTAGRQQLRGELRQIHAQLYTGPWAWLRRLCAIGTM
ncbi:hypothetical protein GCM10022409_25040 [Hymenobacter glaciei]|uniref:Uncharacterized protein n=1 Tax=Hymenobacter glaciei TaxID=877209 RepID=A0ABP7U9R0_9BACT